MRCSLIVALFAICLGLSGMLHAAEWPKFLGPNADGISPDTLTNTNWKEKEPALIWTVDLTDNGYAGPSVADGKVFIIDHSGSDDIVRALDLKTGAEVWRYTYPDTDKNNYGFARSTPVIDGERVYTLSRLGVINCLEMKTGKMIWSRNVQADFGGKRPTWDLSISPFIDNDKLILVPGGNNADVVALNKMTGETIWVGSGSDAPGYATPVLATIQQQRQYVIFTATTLSGIDPATGKSLWSFPWKTSYGVNAAAPIVIGNSIYITSAYGQGSALVDIAPDNSAKSRWESKEIQSRFSTPVYADGYVYTTTEANHLMCVDVQTGEIKWKQSGFEWGGIVGIDGMIIVCDGKTGEMALVKIDPGSYQEFGRIKPLGGQSWTAPIISDGKLIVRNKKTIACLDLQ